MIHGFSRSSLLCDRGNEGVHLQFPSLALVTSIPRILVLAIAALVNLVHSEDCLQAWKMECFGLQNRGRETLYGDWSIGLDAPPFPIVLAEGNYTRCIFAPGRFSTIV